MNNSEELEKKFETIKELVKNSDKKVLIYKEVENELLKKQLFEIKESNITMDISPSNGTYNNSFRTSSLVNDISSLTNERSESERPNDIIESETQNIIDEINLIFEYYVMENKDGNKLLSKFEEYCKN